MNTINHSTIEQLQHRLLSHLQSIYPEHDHHQQLAAQLLQAMRLDPHNPESCIATPAPHTNLWDQGTVMAITYGDSIVSTDEAPLQSLHNVLNKYFTRIINCVHILPFFPWSADDGFAVIDYLQVNEALGTWEDIEALSQDFKIMGDLVINHCSSRSRWFENYKKRVSPGIDYFCEASPDDDLSMVVRPRTTPLLKEVETLDGTRHVWCTFSHDQVDLNFQNPQVLLEIAQILRFYLDRGVSVFRLDAVAFLWKQLGTPSINLPQTHEIIRLLRTLIEHCDPNAILLTETNIPNRENLSYFGNANEAHAIYNFSLPPLLLYALVSGDMRALKTWLMSMPPAQNGTAYLNFIASHDGIGLRPAEGLLSESEVNELATLMQRFGGRISWRVSDNGQNRPYELNIALYDAMRGTLQGGEDGYQLARFLCAHAVMLALEGIPAIYIHSFFATENDYQRLEHTSHNRSINRHQWSLEALEDKLATPHSHHAKIFDALSNLLIVRRRQRAFHPNATQFTLHLGDHLFGFWRQSSDRMQSIFCIYNLTNEKHTLLLSQLNLIEMDEWHELVTGTRFDNLQQSIELKPYEYVWISNR